MYMLGAVRCGWADRQMESRPEAVPRAWLGREEGLTQTRMPPTPCAPQTAAWGTLGVLRTFLSFSVDKDVQRLLRAIAGQGEPRPSALGERANGRS